MNSNSGERLVAEALQEQAAGIQELADQTGRAIEDIYSLLRLLMDTQLKLKRDVDGQGHRIVSGAVQQSSQNLNVLERMIIPVGANKFTQNATVILYPTKQALLQEATPTTNYGIENSDVVSIKDDLSGGARIRTMLTFDISGLPAGVDVLSATLKLSNQQHGGGDPSGESVAVHEMSQAWVEDQCTWNVYSTGNNWAAAGGDFGAGKATTTPSASAGSTISFDVLSLLTSWDTDTIADFMVKFDSTDSYDAELQYDGMKYSISVKSPELTLVYADPGQIWIEGGAIHFIDENGKEQTVAVV